MNRKLALKRLTLSDLTFFKFQYDSNKLPDGSRVGGNQKSININKDPFFTRFYPALRSKADLSIRIGLEIYGPGLVSKPHILNRAIRLSAKNLRLNGEFVHDPDSSDGFTTRYHKLSVGALTLMEFYGDDVQPEKLKVLLINEGESEDKILFETFDQFLGLRSMIALEDYELKSLASALSGLNQNHPLQTFLLDEEELEAAATGAAFDFDGSAGEDSSAAGFNVTAPPSLRIVSSEALKKAKENAEANGAMGEGLLNELFKGSDDYRESEWSSKLNAVSPFDFRVTRADGERQLIEVKSTSSSFGAKIHISLNEVRQAAVAQEAYLIFRVYEMDEDGAKLRISADIKEFAKKLLQGVSGFPAGVMPDGFTLNLNSLEGELGFGKEIYLSVTED
jgi:hypothetical protein